MMNARLERERSSAPDLSTVDYVRLSRQRRALARPRRSWRGLLGWLAMGVTVCGLLAGGAFIGLYSARPELDAQSRDFANASVKAIITSWNRDELLSRAAPALADAANGDYARSFDSWKALGTGAKNEGCVGRSTLSPLSRTDAITAQYWCKLDVKDGTAVATLSLRKDFGAWSITAFYVSSPAAAPKS